MRLRARESMTILFLIYFKRILSPSRNTEMFSISNYPSSRIRPFICLIHDFFSDSDYFLELFNFARLTVFYFISHFLYIFSIFLLQRVSRVLRQRRESRIEHYVRRIQVIRAIIYCASQCSDNTKRSDSVSRGSVKRKEFRFIRALH